MVFIHSVPDTGGIKAVLGPAMPFVNVNVGVDGRFEAMVCRETLIEVVCGGEDSKNCTAVPVAC